MSYYETQTFSAVVESNGIKTLSANDSSTFPSKGKLIFSISPKGQPKNPPDCPISCNSGFGNFLLTDESFAKNLRNLKNCVLVNNNLESPKTFDENAKVTSMPFFIPNFNSISCELDNLTFKMVY